MRHKLTYYASIGLGLIVSGLMFFALMTLPGCALFKTNTVAEQLIIQELTAVAIQSGCSTTSTTTAQACYDERAAKVLAVATSLKTVNAGSAAADVLKLLQGELAQLKLTPEETAPLNAFVTALVGYLSSTYGAGVLSTAALADVQLIAGWIAAEAAIY